MKKKLLHILAGAMLCGSIGNLSANDNVTRIQTLTFDSVLTRQGTWQFPDASKKYRKIVMNYTLKCDPKTAHDAYDCGEWDYLTYNVIHHNTGRDTSYARTHRKYMLGASTADKLEYAAYNPEASSITRTGRTTISGKRITSDGGSPETIAAFTGSDEVIARGTQPFRLQVMIPFSELRDKDLMSKTFGRMQLMFNNAGGAVLKNLKVKMLNTTTPDFTGYRSGMTTLFEGDYECPADGLGIVDFFEDFATKNRNSLVIEISADGFSSETAELVGSGFSGNAFFGQNTPKILKFDGTNDYVYSKNPDLLKNVTRFTMEAFVRIDSWKNWAKIMGIGDQLHFETGDTQGDLYFMIRNGMNSYGKVSGALTLGEWAHIAVTYDGTQENNSDKLKIFINGQPATTTYTGILPNYTAGGTEPFTVSSLEWNSACVDAGIFDVRIWDKTLPEEEIATWSNKFLTSEHPSYDNLLLNYTFQDIDDITVKDSSPNHNDGAMFGFPGVCQVAAVDNPITSSSATVPAISLISGEFTRDDCTLGCDYTEYLHPVSLAEFEITDHAPVIKSIQKVLLAGDNQYYAADGTISEGNSQAIEKEGEVTNEDLAYQTASEPLIEEIEIGRFITPYGKGLDLGPDGFTWKYDVTDYEPYLHGDVTFSAGNLQELIDVSFDFYEGIPPRDVVKMTEIWGSYRSMDYRDMASDIVLRETSLVKQPETRQLKLKTRLTGHGHQSNDGAFPHCCEWKDNTHTITTEEKEHRWHVWQEYDCALNPVFPQGGTWPGSREGWCPGDVVKDFDFELPEYSNHDDVWFDYSITPVPSDNQGMGTGNYIVAMQVFEYGAQNHDLDAEVVDVISPNNFPLYSRVNPICVSPKIIIRNNGSSDLTSLKFEYGIAGKTDREFTWTGSLGANLKDTVELPITADFWYPAAEKKFSVKISEPNGGTDQYADNNGMTTDFELPDIYEKGCTLVLTAPTNYASTIHMTVKDMSGNIVINRSNISNNVSYRDVLDLPDGCYTMEIISDEQIGISYWAVSEMGSGSLKILAPDGTTAKVFQPDFGYRLTYSFSIGAITSVEDMQADNLLRLYPNPTIGEVRFRVDENLGLVPVELYDNSGRMLMSDKFDLSNGNEGKFNIAELSAGSYFIRIVGKNYDIKKNFIKK